MSLTTTGAMYPVVAERWVTAMRGSAPVTRARVRSFRFGYNDAFFEDPNLIPLADQGGAKTVRLAASWCHAQPSQGATYDWTVIDNQFARVVNSDDPNDELAAIVNVNSAPYWATEEARTAPDSGQGDPCLDRDENSSSPPATTSGPSGEMSASLQAWRDYITALLTRAAQQGYLPHIDAIEVWNEPNLGKSWGDEVIDPVRYAQVYLVAWDGVESARASFIATGDQYTARMIDRIPIITGGLSPIPPSQKDGGPNPAHQLSFLRQALNEIKGSAADKVPNGVGVHLYVNRAPDGAAAENGIADQYGEIGTALSDAGMPSKARWVTEFGHPSKPHVELPNGDPDFSVADDYDRQRDILRRLFRYLRFQANPKPISLLVHRVVDADPAGEDPKSVERRNFGTMRFNGTGPPARKRAYCALARELKHQWHDCDPLDE